MSFTLDEGTGTIFKNQDKSEEKHPDYKGKIMLDGQEKSIALWLRKSKKGTSYMFAKVSEFKKMPDEVRQAIREEERQVAQPSFDDDLSDVPF